MPTTVTALSSMATRAVLAELCAAWRERSGVQVALEATAGVEAAQRIAAGERFDVVVLAADAIDRLMAGGHVVAGSRIDLVRSPVAVAVRAGAPRPDIASEAAVRDAVRAARSVGFSTGPSGVFLQQLFERWGLAAELEGRLVQAKPGVPVGRLVAEGRCELGFQQLSELMHEPGIDVLGLLPPEVAYVTTFSAALPANSTQAAAARAWLAFANSDEAAAAKRRHGMEPAAITIAPGVKSTP